MRSEARCVQKSRMGRKRLATPLSVAGLPAILAGTVQADFIDFEAYADGQNLDGNMVPVPGAALLGMLGLGCAGCLRRRRAM